MTAAPRPPVPPVTRTVRSLTPLHTSDVRARPYGFRPCSCVTSPTDRMLDQVLLVRAAELRTQQRRHAVPEALPRRPHRPAHGDRPRRRARGARAVPGRPRPSTCAGRYEIHPRWGAQLALRAPGRGGPGLVRLRRPRRRPAALGRDDGARGPRAVATVQDPHLHALLDRVLGPHTRDVGALPARAGGQALPPGLRARPARALPHRRPGRERDGLDLPRHRSRRRGHRRAAARHRQARGLHRRPRRRSTSPTPAACRARSRWATTASAAPSRSCPASRPRPRRRCCTSSSATTARSSTAAPSCPAPARRGSCT